MVVPAVLLALLVAAPIRGPLPHEAVPAVPDEPGTVVLPDARILQSVAADVDGDGLRELIRLVRDADEAALAEVWTNDGGRWRLLGEPVEFVPPARVGRRIDAVYSATPVRLLVRRVGGVERVTVASQPHFEEIDVGPACCLLLHDLVIEGGRPDRVEVAGPSDSADSVLVIDLDGDRTDELLVTRNLPPAGDIGYPILARVHRWTGSAFGPPTTTQLEIGSGDTPFVVGDSDGLPGDEAAIASTLGPPGLFRIRLGGPGDLLVVDAAGFVADQALAVPIEDGRGVAAVGPVVGLRVAAWPPGAAVADPPFAESAMPDARLVGTVVVKGRPRLVVHQPATEAIGMLGLPSLTPGSVTITRSPAAAILTSSPLRPYSGPLPGGGADGTPSIIHAGRLVPAPGAADPSGTALMATLAGAEPIGLVGRRDQLALHHAPLGPPALDARGGALAPPAAVPLAWTSIAPLAVARTPETDDGSLDPRVLDAVALDDRGGIAAGPAGFRVEVRAPPGSRVVAADFDPSVARTPIVVPDSGISVVGMPAPALLTPNPRHRAILLVSTPGGHAYLAAWDVRVLTEPPRLEVDVFTPLGSSSVEVRGSTDPHATVWVDGRSVAVGPGGQFATTVDLPPWPSEIRVEADDRLGNVARTAVSGVGLLDYRRLPWVPIVVVLVAAAGALLLLRVPHSAPLPRRADDDADLEEIESD